MESTEAKIEYKISECGSFIKFNIDGAPTLDDFKQVISELTMGNLVEPGVSFLCDLSRSSLSHVNDVQYLSARTYAFSQLSSARPQKVALVGGNLKCKGTREILKRCLAFDNVRVFYQMADAVQWISCDSQVAA